MNTTINTKEFSLSISEVESYSFDSDCEPDEDRVYPGDVPNMVETLLLTVSFHSGNVVTVTGDSGRDAYTQLTKVIPEKETK